MDEEQTTVVDNKDDKIGIIPRKDLTAKHIHRSVYLLLFNSRNQVLLQKRSRSRKLYPSLYTWSVAGHVADESYDDAIVREMREEIGFKAPFRFLFKYYFADEHDNAFRAVYVSRSDHEVIIDPNEAECCVWYGIDELKKDLAVHPERFTPPIRYGLNIFFEKYYPVKF